MDKILPPENYQTSKFWIFLAWILVSLLKLYGLLFPYYPVDIPVNIAWCEFLASQPLRNFYDHFHVVYGPLNLYFFWMLGYLAKFLSLDRDSLAWVLRIFAMCGDYFAAYLLYRFLRHPDISTDVSKYKAHLFSLLWLCLPGVYFNSGIWGQFDGWLCAWFFLLFYTIYFSKLRFSLLCFTIALLSKPQTLMLAPVYCLWILHKMFKNPKTTAREITLGGMLSFSGIVVLLLPFYNPLPTDSTISLQTLAEGFKDLLLWLPRQYLGKADDYPYLSANAFNFWFAIGKQTFPDTEIILNSGVTYKALSIALVCALSFIIFRWNQKKQNHLEVFYLQLSLCFALLSRMHERYGLYILVPLILLVATRSKLYFWSFMIWNLIIFANHYYVYSLSFQNIYWLPSNDYIGISFGALASLIFILDLNKNLSNHFTDWRRYTILLKKYWR